MDHGSCITVKIQYKIVYDKITDHFLYVNYPLGGFTTV